MKNKLQKINREEKKELLKKIKNSEQKTILVRLQRLLITGIIGIIIASLMITLAFYMKAKILDYISALILLIFSIIFIISSIKTQEKLLNKFALKNNKNSE